MRRRVARAGAREAGEPGGRCAGAVALRLPLCARGPYKAGRSLGHGGKKYLEFHQKLLGGRGQADLARALAAAKEVGLDVARIEKDMASDEVKATIEENFKLAETLGLNGTPSYVVGNDVLVGAVG